MSFRPAVDALLLLVVFIWAINFSVVKAAITHIPALAFNTLRLLGSSVLLLALARAAGKLGLPRDDRPRILFLSLVGHTAYQICFILGIDATTATHSALLLGMTPVAVALVATVAGVERSRPLIWVGIAASLAGVTLVLHRAPAGAGSLSGDALTLLATLCWAVYTVFGRGLLVKHGPLKITTYTMAVGTLFFLPLGLPSLVRAPLGAAPAAAWIGLAYSFVFALGLAYYLWYYAVARIGATRTAVYSNLTPVVAVTISVLTLGESFSSRQWAGAAIIFLGIYLVRREPRVPSGRRV